MSDSLASKKKILKNFLNICLLHGWNNTSLEEAVKASGFKENKYFKDIYDLINFFIEQGNEELEKKAKKIKFEDLRIRDKIKELVKLRILVEEKNKNALKALLTISKGRRIPTLLKNSYKISDVMWKIIKDKSTNYSFYTKRIILSKIFIKTLICFIDDDSKNYQDSWKLLDNEIEKVMKIGKIKAVFSNVSKGLKNIKPTACNLKEKLKELPFFRLMK